nr:hypothetical protein [Tanacetum cinerariifolium]
MPVVTEAVNTACYTQNRSIIVKRHEKTTYDMLRGRSPDISYFYMFGCPVHIHSHKDHLGKFDEKVDDGFFLGFSPVAKTFRVLNIIRQEIEETILVTFSEDDEAILQSNTEGDAINFNDNRSFPDDEFLEPRSKSIQCPGNIKYFLYIPAYKDIIPTDSLIPQDFVSPEEPPEFTSADDHIALKELDKPNDNIESAKIQNNVTNKPISDVHPSPIISPSAEGSETQSTSAHECLYEWIDYEEAFAPITRLEAIRIFLAYAVYMGFMVYQMDMKSAFLNGEILEEYDLADSALVKCLMLPLNNLGPDESGVSVNETLFRGMIRSLMYLTASRPDIQFSICLCARKSTSRGSQILGGKLVCWSVKKQSSVAISSAEAKYVVATGCCAQVLWIKSQLTNYDVLYDKVPIFCDNTSAITISNNPLLHSRTKHIDIRYHFIRDNILKGDIKLHFVPTDLQLAEVDEATKTITFSLSSFEKPHPLLKPAEGTVATVDATKSLDAFKSAEEQVNQPKTAEAIKDEVKESGLKSIGDVTFDQIMDEIDQKNKAESLYNTTQSDPLGYLHEELCTLNTKVDQLESSISKQVTDDIQSFVPSIVADALK